MTPLPSAAQVQEVALRDALTLLLQQCTEGQYEQFLRLHGRPTQVPAAALPRAYELVRRTVLANRAFPDLVGPLVSAVETQP